MNTVLNRLIMDHKGPWKDYAPESRTRCISICEAVLNEIISSIIGQHPAECDQLSAEYDWHLNGNIWIYLTFTERATHTAEQISTAIQEISGVAVNVKVWEAVSEYMPK